MTKAKAITDSDVIPVDPDDTVEETMVRLIDCDSSGLPVVDTSGRVVGVITVFDLLDVVWDTDMGNNKVYDYMTGDIQAVDENDDLEAMAELFRLLPSRLLPVM